jgi:hypothetical protein
LTVRTRRGIAAAVLLAALLGACGHAGAGSVVARVGSRPITKAMVDRWASVVRRGGAFTGFRGAPYGGSPKQRAFALLISSSWLIGEAARQGPPVRDEAVNAALRGRLAGGGEAEFHKMLRRTGQTIAGVKLELRAELALEAIREKLARRAADVTEPEVASFYRRNRRLFRVPETRLVDIIEGLPSAAAATKLVRHIGTGRRFAAIAYHKKMALTPGVLAGPANKKRVDYAVFASRPGVASQPMSMNSGWTVFVVRKIIPARAEPLRKVHGEVLAAVTQQRERRIASAFQTEYVRRWTSSTTCQPGYAAPGCAHYAGSLGRYKDPFFDAPTEAQGRGDLPGETPDLRGEKQNSR